jgi:hypothetical protein
MRATSWEFEHRALIFGLIFGISSLLYFIDHDNSTATVANWLGVDAELVARAMFACAALLLAFSAFIRTWASSGSRLLCSKRNLDEYNLPPDDMSRCDMS